LENTSAEQLAQDLLAHCLEARPWPEHLLADLVACSGDRELFRVVVERLADRAVVGKAVIRSHW